MNNQFNISLAWYDEAHVWMATSEDIYELVMEHGSLDALIERVRYGVLDLLDEENRKYDDISLNFDISTRTERLVMSG